MIVWVGHGKQSSCLTQSITGLTRASKFWQKVRVAMRLAEINPMTGRAFDAQSYRKAGNWAWRDGWDYEGMPVRYVWHYSTLMFEFVGNDVVPWRVSEWRIRPHSLGYGSVSDQRGCNRIIGATGGLYYSRKGGAKWEVR